MLYEVITTYNNRQDREWIFVQGGNKEKKKFSPGLSLKDVEAIAEVVPSMEKMSPEIVLDTYIIKNGM